MKTQLEAAVKILKAGGVVAFPTETVYGLGADATNVQALQKVFQVKERPLNNPLIVHITNVSMLQAWALNITPEVLRLAKAFWPGPLTMILPRQPGVLDLLTANQDTVALRVPNHPVTLELLAAFGGGLAGPSANKFTRLSPTNAEAVRAELGSEIDFVLDGGDCTVGVESTIISMVEAPTILRPGMISATEIANVLNMPVTVSTTTHKIRAPGRYLRHYAPRTPTSLVSRSAIASLQPTEKAILLTYSHATTAMPVIKMPQNAQQYAQVLYQTLRLVDNEGYESIMVEAVPEEAAWDAIRDRLKKACY